MEDQQTTNQQKKRTLPQSELDYNLLVTDGLWGNPNISEELKEKLRTYFVKKDEEGQPITDKQGNIIATQETLWGLLGYYTRDMRLANLSQWNGETNYCQYYLDLAGDFLQAGMIEPFLISLSRVATVLELSQSKNGFLRRRMHTLTTESMSGEIEPPKKGLFGTTKKKEGGM